MAKKKLSQKLDNKPYARKVEKPWGWEIHFVPDNKPYMGKILHVNAGARLSLQYHDKKEESWWLISGKAKLLIDDAKGDLEEIELKPGSGYSSQAGQRHRLVGVTDCDIIEVSTPEVGTTYRLEDDYKRTGRNEDAKERKLRNSGEI